MVSTVTPLASLRFRELRTLLNEIARQESKPPEQDSETVVILRGLFFVHLYGAFEYSVNSAVQRLLQAISVNKIPYEHLEQLFYAVALDADFTSISDRPTSGKWNGRTELLIRQQCKDLCKLNDTAFGRDLQNIWFKTLEELFLTLNVNRPVLPEKRYRGYIDEVVEKRNAIAHGRESPTSVGVTRAADLEIRLKAVSETAFYIIDCLNLYLQGYEFVDAAYRDRYLERNS